MPNTFGRLNKIQANKATTKKEAFTIVTPLIFLGNFLNLRKELFTSINLQPKNC